MVTGGGVPLVWCAVVPGGGFFHACVCGWFLLISLIWGNSLVTLHIASALISVFYFSVGA